MPNSLCSCKHKHAHLSVRGVTTRRALLPRYSYPYSTWAFIMRTGTVRLSESPCMSCRSTSKGVLADS